MPEGLLFVLGETGKDVTTEEFNGEDSTKHWYDNDHAPMRLTVKGFHNALRYEAVDNLEPRWLALYDLDNPEVMTSDEYKSLAHKATEREKPLVARLKLLNRRVYSLIARYGNSEDPRLPSKYVVTETSDAEELRAEESINLISKVPGWIQSRRYKLVSATELAGQTDKNAASTPAAFINIHYFDRPFEKSLSEAATSADIRIFALYKDIGKPSV